MAPELRTERGGKGRSSANPNFAPGGVTAGAHRRTAKPKVDRRRALYSVEIGSTSVEIRSTSVSAPGPYRAGAVTNVVGD